MKESQSIYLEGLIAGGYKIVPSEATAEQANTARMTRIRSPGGTDFVHNLQQANAVAEEGIFLH